MRKFLSIILSITIMLVCIPNSLAADGDVSMTVDENGIVTVTAPKEMSKIEWEYTRNNGHGGDWDDLFVFGTSCEFGLPVRSIRQDIYDVSIWITYVDGTTDYAEVSGVQLGVQNPTGAFHTRDYFDISRIGPMRVITVPYANVYQTSALSGDPVVQLKRHDLVRIVSMGSGYVQIRGLIQSGNGTTREIGPIHGVYEPADDDIEFEGYISINDIDIRSQGQIDTTQEVIELAYSRLGTKGVYSQLYRLTDFYLDCSAFVSWVWYMAGVDITPYGTSCNGLARWAESQSSNVILWEAQKSTAAQDDIAAQKAALGIDSNAAVVFSDSDGNTYNEDRIISYQSTVPQAALDAMLPGDIILFNHKAEAMTSYNGVTIPANTYYIDEDGITGYPGFDHAAIFAGKTYTLTDPTATHEHTDACYSCTYNILETSNPQRNTVANTLTASGQRNETIAMIFRPWTEDGSPVQQIP